jgi:hypothetical protein
VDDLTNMMRTATAEPPPTSIDLDQLIAGEQRRSRQLRWAASAGGVAAAVAAVVFATTVLSGWGAGKGGGSADLSRPAVEFCAPLTPSPTGPTQPKQSYGTVRPRPTEPVADVVGRLTAVLNDTLLTHLPDVRVAAVGLAGCERPQFQHDPSRDEYSAGARLADTKGSGSLSLRLIPTGAEEPFACQPNPGGLDCERRTLPGGAVAKLLTFPMDGGTQYQVTVDRPDGTTVFLLANNLDYGGGSSATPKVTRPEPVLTLDQMVALGVTPGLTLYP